MRRRRPTDAVVLLDIPLTGSTTVHDSVQPAPGPRALRSHSRSRRNGDQGSTAVEFALVLPAIVTTVFFAIYGGLYFYYGAMADHVARSVAREVSIPIGETGSAYPDANPATVTADAKAAAGTLIPTPTSAVATPVPNRATPQEGDMVRVTVTYKLPVLDQMPFFGSFDTITRSASERRQ